MSVEMSNSFKQTISNKELNILGSACYEAGVLYFPHSHDTKKLIHISNSGKKKSLTQIAIWGSNLFSLLVSLFKSSNNKELCLMAILMPVPENYLATERNNVTKNTIT